MTQSTRNDLILTNATILTMNPGLKFSKMVLQLCITEKSGQWEHPGTFSKSLLPLKSMTARAKFFCPGL